jgi:hypothetical protein
VRVHHHTASHGTSVVEAGFGPYGSVPAGLAQHSSPDGEGVTSAGVHSGSSSRRLPAPAVPGAAGARPSLNRSTVWSTALHHCRRTSGTLVAAHVMPWRRLTVLTR